jgi:FKBP-type peptidyl-prolyl cis-trans isomerase FklB
MNMRLSAVLLSLALAASAWAQAPAAAPAAKPAAAPATATAPSAFKTEKERMGYALGLQLGGRLKGVDIDYAAIAAGIKDAATGAKSLMSDDEIDASMTALQKIVMAQADAQQAAEAENNQKAGDAFLAANAKKDGVKTTASGLQYKILKAGAGKTPAATDTVSVNYTGTLIDGKTFDSSDGTPVSFPVNRIIPGWTEALQLMKEGDTWQLFIPAKLAYAERGAGQDIGPNSVLIFEVELISVKAAPASAPAAPALPIQLQPNR